MKIVVLDGYTLNPGDLSWKGFEEMGEVVVYDRTPPELTVDRAAGAEAVLTNKVILGKKEISQLPLLEYIGVLATGYNVVDIEAASRRNITVTNIPGYSTDSVAQMVFAHLLNICHSVQKHNDMVKEGAWSQSKDFSFWQYPLIELAGKTMGIIGFGKIGRKVSEIANAFGMNVIVYSRTMKEKQDLWNIRWVDFHELLRSADVVSLHCPLVPQTENLIDRESISFMKKGAILINSSRGPVINESDLAHALRKGKIAWAAVDVLSSEPPSPNNPLLSVENCLITPHISWATWEARYRLMEIAQYNLKTYLASSPVNTVN